jgi:hypothetical protein
MHIADYIVIGFLIASMLLAAAVVLSRTKFHRDRGSVPLVLPESWPRQKINEESGQHKPDQKPAKATITRIVTAAGTALSWS